MKISVLTPSFNSGKYIARAIQSVCRQDYVNWEHIVIDGGSTDGTISILEKYPHLIWDSKPDKGQSDAMNSAFEKSTGDIVIYLNADDELGDGLLSHIVEKFRRHPDNDIVVGNLRINHMGKISIRTPSISLVTILQYWPCRFPVNPVSYAYKRSLQVRIGKFPVSNHYTMDYWFLLRSYLFGRPLKTDFLTGTYHIDGNNKSINAVRGKEHLKAVRNDFLKIYFYRPHVMIFLFRWSIFCVLKPVRRVWNKVLKRI